jgi:hypothetical protein
MNPVGDIITDGASLLTLWHLAVQTALRLLDGFCHRIALVDLFLESHVLSSCFVFLFITAKVAQIELKTKHSLIFPHFSLFIGRF